jgi:hypothetical protein
MPSYARLPDHDSIEFDEQFADISQKHFLLQKVMRGPFDPQSSGRPRKLESFGASNSALPPRIGSVTIEKSG